MNRIIKFRAWDKDRGKMIPEVVVGQNEVRLFENGDFYKLWKQNESMDYGDVMQFTGLKDKNGKECFEGDLIKTFGHSFNDFGRVFYDDEAGAFGVLTRNKMELGFLDFHSFEIVGNIYENPELLK